METLLEMRWFCDGGCEAIHSNIAPVAIFVGDFDDNKNYLLCKECVMNFAKQNLKSIVGSHVGSHKEPSP